MFVRNDSGTVHSVPDDFQLPGEPPAYDGWEEVTEAEAPDALLGKATDPAVDAVELHDLSAQPVVDESGPAHEPGEVDGRQSNDIQPADATQVEAPAEPEQAPVVEPQQPEQPAEAPAAPEVTA